MTLKWASFAGAALAAALFVSPVSAAPIGSLDGAKPDTSSAAEQVAYRRCWTHKGKRHCRWVKNRNRNSYGYNSYRYNPGFSIYLGGNKRHGHRNRGYRGYR